MPSSLSCLFCGVAGVRGAGEVCGAAGVGRVAGVLGDAGGVGSSLELATALRTTGRAAEKRARGLPVPCFATCLAVTRRRSSWLGIVVSPQCGHVTPPAGSGCCLVCMLLIRDPPFGGR